MKINYGINRRCGVPGDRKRMKHKNGHLNMEGDWENQTFHGQIRQEIQQRHPGWSITGYAVAPEEVTNQRLNKVREYADLLWSAATDGKDDPQADELVTSIYRRISQDLTAILIGRFPGSFRENSL